MGITTFCAQPLQCPMQHRCRRNLDIWRGPMPAEREMKFYESPPDCVCPGFSSTTQEEVKDASQNK